MNTIQKFTPALTGRKVCWGTPVAISKIWENISTLVYTLDLGAVHSFSACTLLTMHHLSAAL